MNHNPQLRNYNNCILIDVIFYENTYISATVKNVHLCYVKSEVRCLFKVWGIQINTHMHIEVIPSGMLIKKYGF